MVENKKNSKIEIYRGLEGEVIFDVDVEAETIWATSEQMAEVFGVQRPAIVKHLSNIYKSGELDEKVTCSKMEQVRKEGERKVVRTKKIYNLDAIISVGYRVNSKKATGFRIWATKVLKKYVTDGVAVNEQRLKELKAKKDLAKLRNVEDIVALVRRLTTQIELGAGEANGIIEIISKYTGSFETIKEYDDGHIDLSFMGSRKKGRVLTVEMCTAAIERLRESMGGSELFGRERKSANGKNLSDMLQELGDGGKYSSVPEKAANLLYFVIKERPFCDGNKRIGALLFVLFLTMNDYHLTNSGETKISDRALTAITLLISESKPQEKELVVNLVCKLLG